MSDVKNPVKLDPEKLFNFLSEHVESQTPIKVSELKEMVIGNPASAMIFCVGVIRKRDEEIEKLIAESTEPGCENLRIAYCMGMYKDNNIPVKDGPIFDKIMEDSEACIRYVQMVSEERVPEFEPIIMRGGEEIRKRYTDLLHLFKERDEENKRGISGDNQ